MGLTTDPTKGDNFRPIGVDDSGKMLYSSQSMITSPDAALGAKSIENTVGVINGFGTALNKNIFDEQETAKLNTIASNSKDPAVIAELTGLKQNQDPENFIEKIFDYVTDGVASVTNTGVKSGKTKKDGTMGDLMEGAGTAYQAYSLYQNWDYLSPAQKGMGLAAIGMKALKTSAGEKFGKKVLVDATLKADGSELTPALKVKDALNLFSTGTNAYSLAKNWDQLSDLSKLVGGARTVIDIAKTAKGLGMLGEGLDSAAVKVTAQQLTSTGYSSVPHMGIGAVIGPSDAPVPKGYTVVTHTDRDWETEE
jgi:hypothetical protein